MTEEQILLFKTMCKTFWSTFDIINDNYYLEFDRNSMWELYEILEQMTGQPVTDWV